MIPRPVRSVRFGDYSAPVSFDDCDDLLSGFRSILRGWDVVEHPPKDDEKAIIRFRKCDGRFVWKSKQLPPPADWKRRGPRKVMDAVADFHYRFLDWHSLEYRDQFCLHCAAVHMGDGLVIFPSAKKAGKSTLMTELAMNGFEVFCDDVLPVDLTTGRGVALGILPRLRLPLPDTISDDHRDFVTKRTGISDRYAAYIEMRATELATFGRQARIKTIVLLQRQADPVAARLEPARDAEALARMIDQNYARHLSPTLIFESMLRIVANARCCRLVFSDVANAAVTLEREFGV